MERLRKRTRHRKNRRLSPRSNRLKIRETLRWNHPMTRHWNHHLIRASATCDAAYLLCGRSFAADEEKRDRWIRRKIRVIHLKIRTTHHLNHENHRIHRKIRVSRQTTHRWNHQTIRRWIRASVPSDARP